MYCWYTCKQSTYYIASQQQRRFATSKREFRRPLHSFYKSLHMGTIPITTGLSRKSSNRIAPLQATILETRVQLCPCEPCFASRASPGRCIPTSGQEALLDAALRSYWIQASMFLVPGHAGLKILCDKVCTWIGDLGCQEKSWLTRFLSYREPATRSLAISQAYGQLYECDNKSTT
jgi:hypothetical protein